MTNDADALAGLRAKTDDLHLAITAHVVGTTVALKAAILSIARQLDLDVAAVIADLDQAAAEFPIKPVDPRSLIATGVADLLRLATQRAN